MIQKKIFFSVIILLILGTIATVVINKGQDNTPGKYDTFAQCLKDKGATFYGAFWCPHCKAQKALFGSSVKLLPYVECSLPDASGPNQLCKDKKIAGYPTWEFTDGTRPFPGEASLQQLADKTTCSLPK
jgi:thiol-disulfide isomerase/thioredoxin